MKNIVLLWYFSASMVAAAQWEILDQDNDCIYTAVYFINDSTGFVIGNCGFNGVAIKKTTDYGNTWTVVYTGENDLIHDIYFPSDTVGYCSTHENVLKTINGGITWFYPTPEFEGYPYRSIVFQDNDIGFGCFADGGAAIAQTTDGGYTWNEDYTYGGREILMNGDCEVRVISGQYGKSNDCWQNYETIFANVGQRTISNFAFSEVNLILACGQGISEDTWQNFGFIVKSINDGSSWTIQDYGNIYALRSIVNVNSTTYYCVGQAYNPNPFSFLKTNDGGETWGYQEYDFVCETCFSPDIRDIYCPSENVCYAVSGGGAIYRTLNGGGELFPIPVNVEELSEENELQISPVPTHGILQINLPNPFPNKGSIKIYDAFGQLVFTNTVTSIAMEIDLSALANGYYTIQVSDSSVVLTKSFMKE